MSVPRITALIDTFNQGRFIEEAIESVLSQDFPASDMEILVVDDGSTDDTRARVEKYGGRVRYIWKPNGGQASALNLGFEQARGEIVAMLDGDDVWLPNKVRRVVEEFEKHPGAVVVSHPNQNWDWEKNICVNTPNFFPVCGDVLITPENALRYGNFGTSGIAVPVAGLRALLPIPETLRVYADTYLIVLLPFLGPVIGIAEHLTKYRIHGGNLTSFASGDFAKKRLRWECFATAIEEAKCWLKANGFALQSPNVTLHLKRYELVEQMSRFQYRGPGRLEYFRFLREYERVYGSEWRPGYRLFRRILSYASFTLGYGASEALRNSYRGRRVLVNLREELLPARDWA
jgi:glycosyltransferase involved in cell wall biosynthesis